MPRVAACVAVLRQPWQPLEWWVCLLVFFAPDLSFAGYLAGPRIGASVYNAVHIYGFGAAILALGAMTAMIGVLLNLLLGLSRVLLAMGRRHDMPAAVAAVRQRSPQPLADLPLSTLDRMSYGVGVWRGVLDLREVGREAPRRRLRRQRTAEDE